MICPQCGKEHFENICPYCSTAACEDSSARPSNISSGVHSDTVYKSTEQQSNTQQVPPSYSWQQVPPNNFAQTTKPRFCPICGTPVTGAFCGRCGERIEPIPSVQTQQTYNQYQSAPSANQWANQPTYPHQQPSGFSQEFGYQQNVSKAFTDNYQQAIKENRFPKKKTSSWVILLLIFGIIFQIIIPALTSYATFMHRDDLFDGFLEKYTPDYYYDYDKYYNSYPSDYDYDDNLSKYGFSQTVDENAVDTGEPVYENGVSIAEFRQLQVGMSYAQISAIIGGDSLYDDYDENENLICSWIGEYNVNAEVRVYFSDDIAIKIEQKGLD